LVAEIEAAYPDSEVKLVEASGGLFEVTLDGELVFSKRSLGRHANPGEVLELISQHLGD
jgi:selenoprotein W-related protein